MVRALYAGMDPDPIVVEEEDAARLAHAMERATTLIGQPWAYGLLKNCQSFATHCSMGRSITIQAQQLKQGMNQLFKKYCPRAPQWWDTRQSDRMSARKSTSATSRRKSFATRASRRNTLHDQLLRTKRKSKKKAPRRWSEDVTAFMGLQKRRSAKHRSQKRPARVSA